MADLPPWRVPRLVTGDAFEQVLDLSRVDFVMPRGIVAIATYVESAVREGVAVRVIGPSSPDISRYLSRAHLPHVLNELGVQHDFGMVRERNLGNRLVVLTRFSNNNDVVALADSVRDFAAPYGTGSADALHTAVCEAGENVETHAGTPHGYLVAQYYPGNRAFRFALGDSGIGFYGRLSQIGATDAGHALEMAGRAGVTTTGDPFRGLGISSIRNQLVALNGTFVLSTQDRERFFSPRNGEGFASANTGNTVGSLVYGEFFAG